MFNCQSCHKTSQLGEKSAVVPTISRPVLYEYSDGRSYMGTEWAKSAVVCESCAQLDLNIQLQGVKTVEIKVKHERTRVQDGEQHIQA